MALSSIETTPQVPYFQLELGHEFCLPLFSTQRASLYSIRLPFQLRVQSSPTSGDYTPFTYWLSFKRWRPLDRLLCLASCFLGLVRSWRLPNLIITKWRNDIQHSNHEDIVQLVTSMLYFIDPLTINRLHDADLDSDTFINAEKQIDNPRASSFPGHPFEIWNFDQIGIRFPWPQGHESKNSSNASPYPTSTTAKIDSAALSFELVGAFDIDLTG